MSIYRILLVILLLPHPAFAQDRLCIASGAAERSIDFRPAEVKEFLQLDQYKIILFGELHNYSFNPEFEYYLITTLNRYCGIRHIFMEMSVSNAWFFNHYLATGDTSFFKSGSGNWPWFRRSLYEYNRSMPEGRKLVIHGVDFERTEVFTAISHLAPAGIRPPLSLQAMMDTVARHLHDEPLRMYSMIGEKKMLEYDNTAFVNTLRFIQATILAHPEDARQFFAGNYPVIQEIASNKGKVEVRPRHRNGTMYAAIERTVADQHIDKFMGIFGAQHIAHNIGNSISNAVKQLPGISKKDILTIEGLIYNLQRETDGVAYPIDHLEAVKALNGTCKASIIAADQVPGAGKRADFVVIADARK